MSDELSINLHAIANAVESGVNRYAEKIARDIGFALINVTPVDTSLAKSNWILSVGDRVTNVRAAFALGSKGSTSSHSGAAAFADLQKNLSSRKRGDIIHIQNNTPYIETLNGPNTPSRQAPPGFVENVVEGVLDSNDIVDFINSRLRAIKMPTRVIWS